MRLPPQPPSSHLKLLEALGKDSLTVREIGDRLLKSDGEVKRWEVSRMVMSLVESKHLVRTQVGMKYAYARARGTA